MMPGVVYHLRRSGKMTDELTKTKAHAGAVAGGVSAPVSLFLIGFLHQQGVFLGPGIEAAGVMIITAVLVWVATYLAPANREKS